MNTNWAPSRINVGIIWDKAGTLHPSLSLFSLSYFPVFTFLFFFLYLSLPLTPSFLPFSFLFDFLLKFLVLLAFSSLSLQCIILVKDTCFYTMYEDWFYLVPGGKKLSRLKFLLKVPHSSGWEEIAWDSIRGPGINLQHGACC